MSMTYAELTEAYEARGEWIDATLREQEKTMAEADRRVSDVAAEYQKAGKSWDATRARLTAERDEARATIERVRTLFTNWKGGSGHSDSDRFVSIASLRRALVEPSDLAAVHDKADAAMEETG